MTILHIIYVTNEKKTHLIIIIYKTNKSKLKQMTINNKAE